MDIQVTAAAIVDIPLLEALAPAVRRLSADIVLEPLKLCLGQLAGNAALRDAPQLAVPRLHREHGGAHLAVDTVIVAIPMHDATLRFLRHTLMQEGSCDLVCVAHEFVRVHWDRFPIHIAVLIGFKSVAGQRHIQLERMRFRRFNEEAVFSEPERCRCAAVEPHMEAAVFVYLCQRACHAGSETAFGIGAFPNLDAAADDELLPQKVLPALIQCHVYIPPIIMP